MRTSLAQNDELFYGEGERDLVSLPGENYSRRTGVKTILSKNKTRPENREDLDSEYAGYFYSEPFNSGFGNQVIEPALTYPFESNFQAIERINSFFPQKGLIFPYPTRILITFLRSKFFKKPGTRLAVFLITGFLTIQLIGAVQKNKVAEVKIFYPVESRAIIAPLSVKQVSSPSNHSLIGAPSIEPAKIDEVLNKYKSPAAGTGKVFYNLGVTYGIDPAFALAFFIHESSAGTQGVATVTRGIGNIRCTQGYVCFQTGGNGSFRKYSSWEEGIEDWFKLIKDLYIGKWNLKTLEEIIPVYAPSADHNSPTLYIKQVVTMVENWRG